MLNLKTKRKYLITVLLTVCVLIPIISLAAIPGIKGDTGGIVPCVNNCDMTYVYMMINNFITWATYASFAFGVIAFVYAGYFYITSGGDTGKLQKAHDWFKNIFIGLVLVLGAVLIVTTIMQSLLKSEVYNDKNVGAFYKIK
ncbi:MAG: hypothetical protein WCW14_01540 [Candidatus Paceibacterota bacterium]|jgi:hypothetical protein